MKVEEQHLTIHSRFEIQSSDLNEKADLVLYFAGREAIENHNIYHNLKRVYPHAIIMGSSTGGEITSDDVYNETVMCLAIDFEKTDLKSAHVHIEQPQDSFDAGQTIGLKLKGPQLKSIFLLSDGLNVNGSALIKGILEGVGASVPIMGGLAGDGSSFQKTYVGLDEQPSERVIAAVGFYGDHIHFSYGAESGGELVGPERIITKSYGNILYELDGKPALELYKNYLGKYANDLPASALLYPLMVYPKDNFDASVVRTILSINNDDQSMTFAGDMPKGSVARFMSSTKEHFKTGATNAALKVKSGLQSGHTSVGLLISCIGRKLAMGDRVVDEVDAVKDILDDGHYFQAGFFSYGEICPHNLSGVSELHNETMTISAFTEI